jgi:ornithine cyclodeaminase/alanine dehydrogenase-like protein (mu-crystallin family)
MGAILLSSSDIARLLSFTDCIDAVENAFRLLGAGQAERPESMGLHAPPAGGFHVKAGMLCAGGEGGRRYFAAKVNGNFPENPSRLGLPTIQGVVVLSDAEDGRLLALLDSVSVTALRTAAATAVAARYLARPASSVATICGCGVQGRAQLRALREVLPLRLVYAFDADVERAWTFARELSAELDLEIAPADDLVRAVRKSDVCVTCTTSHEFILGTDALRRGQFLAAVGVDNPSKRELAPEVLASSKVVVDMLEQCALIGDLHHALEAGVMKESDVYAELSAVVAEKSPGRESDEEVIVFDSTGIALEDVAAAVVVYERACAALPADFRLSSRGAAEAQSAVQLLIFDF